MPRILLTVSATVLMAHTAAAQCSPWYPPYPYPIVVPAYPLTPDIWGAPRPPVGLPAPIPAAPKRASVREEETPKKAEPKKEAGTTTPKEKSKESPRIPKTRLPLPGDKLDKTVPEVPKTGKTTEPTAGKRYEQFVVPAEGRGEPKAEVKVGFFNHSERDIVLDVNGEPLKLPKEQYVTVRLPRTFQWSEKGAKASEVVVPPDAEGIEIVFRK